MRLFYSFFFLLVLSKSSAQIITDRPDQTESSVTIPKGGVQIESGILWRSAKDDQFSIKQLLAPTVLIRYGVTEHIELRLLSEYTEIKDNFSGQTNNGMTDLQFGTKIQILKKETINTKIAFLSHVILPTASNVLSIEKFGSINKLSISHELIGNINLGYNIGYDYFGVEKGNITYSLSIGIGVSSKLGYFIEPFGAFVNFKAHETNFNTGITYLVDQDIQLDFSYGTGLNNDMNFWSVGASFLILNDN